MRTSAVGQILRAVPAVQRGLPELLSGPQVGALNAADEIVNQPNAHICATGQMFLAKDRFQETNCPFAPLLLCLYLPER